MAPRDAPLDKAIPTIARSITLNTGQICAAGSRVVVDSSIRDEVVSGLADAFKHVRVGPWYEDVDMGPLISAKQEKRVLGILDSRARQGRAGLVGVERRATYCTCWLLRRADELPTRCDRRCGSPRRRSSALCSSGVELFR